MGETILFVGGVLGGIASLIVILKELGVPLQVFGRTSMMSEQTQDSTNVTIKKSTLGWLMLFTILSLLSSGVGWYQHGRENPLKFRSQKMEEIRAHSYVDEVVELDGKGYQDCDFTNVSFLYNGTTPLHFSHNHIHGSFWIKTDSDPIASSLALAKVLGFISVPMTEGPERHPIDTAPTVKQP